MSNRNPSSIASGKGRVIGALTLAAGLSAALFWGCEGSATQTTTGHALSGTLVDPAGSPVSGAMVKAWPSGAVLLGKADPVPAASGRTDAQGRYSLEALEAGEYNVLGEKGNGSASVLIPYVRFGSGELDLGVDTLKSPGAVIGRAMAGGKPLEGVFCYLPGTALVAMTDASGRFALDRVPEGSYKLKYVSEGYAAAVDSPVVVVSAEVTSLPAKNLGINETLQPPAPEWMSASLDSATGIVNLTWAKPAVSDLAGFIVERFYTGPTALVDAGQIVLLKDTATAWQDPDARYMFGSAWSGRDTGTVFYRVKAIDLDGNRSAAYTGPDSVLLHRLEIQKTVVTLMEGPGPGDSPRCRDTLEFKASFTNPVIHLGQIDFRMVGWYGGSPDVAEVYNDKNPVIRGSADTLAWYPGKIQYRPLSHKPEYIDSTTWLNGGNIASVSDSRKPDSLKVIARVWLTGGAMPVGASDTLDVRVDGQGCYRVR